MYIEIKGVEFSNKGAELMLHSIIQALDKHLDSYELVLSPGHLLPYKKRATLGAWQKFSFKQLGFDWTGLGNLAPKSIRRLLKHFGIVVENEIDVVLDASGFVYSDKWGTHRLLETLNQIQRIGKHQSRYFFLPQAFGPFDNAKNGALMKQLINRSELVIARDADSLESLNKLTSSDKILCYPDITPLLDVSHINLPVDLPDQYVCIIPNNKMYRNKPETAKTQYMAFLQEAILVVQALGLTPIVLNHEGEKDRKLCLQLVEMMTIPPLFIDGLNAFEVKKIIGLSVFNLSSRFHGCVSSLSQGVPSLATSWSHKYEQLYCYYECSELLVDMTGETGQLEHKMAQLLAQREEVSTNLHNRADAHKETIEQMWAAVFKRLK